MLNIMFNFLQDNAFWLILMAGIILLIIVLVYIYIRIRRKLQFAEKPYVEIQEDSVENYDINEYGTDTFTDCKENTVTGEGAGEIEGCNVDSEDSKADISKGEDNSCEKAESDNEVLYESGTGDIIVAIIEEGGIKYALIKKGKVLGISDFYQTKAGIYKGIKSLVNYKDTGVAYITESETEKRDNARFEIYSNESGFSYKLKSKNQKTKLYGSEFFTEEECIAAVNAVKSIGETFNL